MTTDQPIHEGDFVMRASHAGLPANAHPIHWVRFAVAGEPRVHASQAVAVAETARLAVMARYGRLTGGASSIALSGKDAAGRPLTAQHAHAHYLCLDEDEDALVDHVLIWVPDGMNALESAACATVDELRDKRVPGRCPRFAPVSLKLAGLNSDPDGLPVCVAGPSSRWRSTTPFVPPRHGKWRGGADARVLVDGPEEQVRRELGHRGLEEGAVTVAVRRWSGGLDGVSDLSARAEPLEDTAPTSGSFAVGLTFAAPVAGPLTLGFGAHFGRGLFRPV